MTTIISGSAPAINSDSDASIQGLTVGRGAGAVATNTAVGASALFSNTTGDYNTAVGQAALIFNTTGDYNTAVGQAALFSNTTGANNTAVGTSALIFNTTGDYNTALGVNTLIFNTTGDYNTAVGQAALFSNTTGANNTAVGYQAGYTNSTATAVTFLGYKAGYASTGAGNTFIGSNAGVASTGTYNTFVGGGNGSGILMTTGSKNVILGDYSGNHGGLDIRTASNYIVLSDGDGNPRGIFDASGNLLVGCTSLPGAGGIGTGFQIGASISGVVTWTNRTNTTSNTEHAVFYNPNGLVGFIRTSGSATSYSTSSDYRLKNTIAPMTGALAKVALLKPCTYKWNADGSAGEGFIAHELAEVCPHAVTGEKDAVDADGNIKSQGIDTSFLVATLTAAIQELKAINDTQAAEIAELKAKVGI